RQDRLRGSQELVDARRFLDQPDAARARGLALRGHAQQSDEVLQRAGAVPRPQSAALPPGARDRAGLVPLAAAAGGSEGLQGEVAVRRQILPRGPRGPVAREINTITN